jgi:hypothetical protein
MLTLVSTEGTEPKLSNTSTLTKSTRLGIPCYRPTETHITTFIFTFYLPPKQFMYLVHVFHSSRMTSLAKTFRRVPYLPCKTTHYYTNPCCILPLTEHVNTWPFPLPPHLPAQKNAFYTLSISSHYRTALEHYERYRQLQSVKTVH